MPKKTLKYLSRQRQNVNAYYRGDKSWCVTQRAYAIYQRNIAAGFVPIFLDHEIEGKMRAFKVYAFARAKLESSRMSFFLSFNIYTQSYTKNIFPHASARGTDDRNSAKHTCFSRRLYSFVGIIPGGTPRRVQFFFFFFVFLFCIRVYVHGIVDASSNAK